VVHLVNHPIRAAPPGAGAAPASVREQLTGGVGVQDWTGWPAVLLLAERRSQLLHWGLSV